MVFKFLSSVLKSRTTNYLTICELHPIDFTSCILEILSNMVINKFGIVLVLKKDTNLMKYVRVRGVSYLCSDIQELMVSNACNPNNYFLKPKYCNSFARWFPQSNCILNPNVYTYIMNLDNSSSAQHGSQRTTSKSSRCDYLLNVSDLIRSFTTTL